MWAFAEARTRPAAPAIAPTPGLSLGELPAGIHERIEELGGGLERLLSDLEQRLDRAARHPAGAVLAIGGELLDDGGQACHAGNFIRRRLDFRSWATIGQETFPAPHALDHDAPAPSISVVIPVYNEGPARLRELYSRTAATLDEAARTFELIFVDDGSTDGTFAELERLHDEDERVRAVRFKRNFGQHAAMHAGLARARGEIWVTMDGDLQNAPEDLPRLIAGSGGRRRRCERNPDRAARFLGGRSRRA